MNLFIVRKPFRSYGEFFPVGKVLPSLEGIRYPMLQLDRQVLLTVDTDNLQRHIEQIKLLEMKAGVSILDQIKELTAPVPSVPGVAKTETTAPTIPKLNPEMSIIKTTTSQKPASTEKVKTASVKPLTK